MTTTMTTTNIPVRPGRRPVLALGLLLILGSCGSADEGGDDASASSSSARAGGKPSEMAGMWRFDVEAPRLNHGAGSYAGATVSMTGHRLVVDGPADARSEFTVSPAGDIEIRCGDSGCSATPGLLAFKETASGFQVVHRATDEPMGVQSGPCGAPPVANSGVVNDFDGTSFSFVWGVLGGNGGPSGYSNCYQVVWTMKASKVSA